MGIGVTLDFFCDHGTSAATLRGVLGRAVLRQYPAMFDTRGFGKAVRRALK